MKVCYCCCYYYCFYCCCCCCRYCYVKQCRRKCLSLLAVLFLFLFQERNGTPKSSNGDERKLQEHFEVNLLIIHWNMIVICMFMKYQLLLMYGVNVRLYALYTLCYCLMLKAVIDWNTQKIMSGTERKHHVCHFAITIG